MSSALRLSIILVLLLASAALGLIAFNLNAAKAPEAVIAATRPGTPASVSYYVAARPLSRGTLARDDDFTIRSTSPDRVPAGAIIETPDTKAGLPGSLVRNFVEAGSPIRLEDILRPKDRGFLASVLAPDSRAISLKVDEESSVSGLIRPGDYVDVLLTQVFGQVGPTHRVLIEMVLANVRVIAIDQEIAQGSRPIGAVVGKQAQTVSLELTSEQVKRIIVAKQLGKLSLAVRAAAERWERADTGAMSGCEVSPELARQNAIAGQSATITIRSRAGIKQVSVRRENPEVLQADAGCHAPSGASRQTANAATRVGASLEGR